MGKRYTVIPQNTFDALQVDVGVLLKNFDIAAAAESVNNPGFTDADLICATTGGINPSCVPTYSDYGDDVDNVPANMLELKHLDSWECKISTTGLGTSPELIKMALGAADIDGSNTSKIIPRRNIDTKNDFGSLWWVGDKANGGFVAIELKNALSTGGFSLQTTKNGKGNVSIELMGHVSMNAQDEVPMVFYSCDPPEDIKYTVTFDSNGGSEVDSQLVEADGLVNEPADPTKTDYTFDGWYVDSELTTPWVFNTDRVNADITLYAKWTDNV